jgi:hypothetical protein
VVNHLRLCVCDLAIQSMTIIQIIDKLIEKQQSRETVALYNRGTE